MKQFDLEVDVYDPWANAQEVEKDYQIKLINEINPEIYQAVIITVAHQEFLTINYQEFKDNQAVIFDTKSIIDRKFADARL